LVAGVAANPKFKVCRPGGRSGGVRGSRAG